MSYEFLSFIWREDRVIGAFCIELMRASNAKKLYLSSQIDTSDISGLNVIFGVLGPTFFTRIQSSVVHTR